MIDHEWRALLNAILNELDNLPAERPVHDERQVMSFEDLEIGRTYRLVQRNATPVKVRMRKLYQDERGHWRVEFVRRSLIGGLGLVTEQLLLTDIGIMPYENGRWNAWNYLCWEEA